MPSADKPLIAVLGPTATGKSSLALTLATRLGGEIINCDSTAVFRGFDIGTDKVPIEQRRDIPHHLMDIVDPTDDYTAAQFARDAVKVIADLHVRGKVPILVGGTGFYYRALTRGLFPGPGKDEVLRDRLNTIAERRGVEFLWRMVKRVDPASAARILPRDRARARGVLANRQTAHRSLCRYAVAVTGRGVGDSDRAADAIGAIGRTSCQPR
jgi:tRNA dimethylallyltransferase